MTKQKLSNQAAELAQKLVRLESADDQGYCSCITCGRIDHWRNMHGGHFIPRTYSRWKHSTINIKTQCETCNCFEGGSPKAFRQYMIDRYGHDEVLLMEETKHNDHGLTRADLEDMCIEYAGRIKKELERIC